MSQVSSSEIMGEIDISSRIKTIELLKSQLLADIAKLYSNMVNTNEYKNDNIDLLADVTILTYLLANEMGTSNEGLNIKIQNKLKLALINENNNFEWKHELSMLKRHFEKK